ncbi:hypothetical protein [Chitinophaga sp.]|uniref:hypothetical protein n=1 Tax=Chitinophaga sp. TaxID=1869181 RepID=UPI0031DB6A5C
MQVEIEQIFEGAYFLQQGKKIRIKGTDLPNILQVIDTLEPILIERAELSLFRFSTMDVSTGTVLRPTSLGNKFWLKPGMGGKWFVGVDEVLTSAYIYYIHQLQRLFFSLFEEQLRYSGDETPTGKSAKKNYYYKPQHQVGSVVVATNHPHTKKGDSRNAILEPVPDELYYLTADMRLLIRSKRLGYAIWEVVASPPLFVHDGKPWGLKLAAGKTVTEEETAKAGKWLLEHLTGIETSFT